MKIVNGWVVRTHREQVAYIEHEISCQERLVEISKKASHRRHHQTQVAEWRKELLKFL